MVPGSNDLREARADVSRRIREALHARGWSVADLAGRMGRSKSSVANLVAGGNGSAGARLRLELAMGTPFWSAPADHAAAVKVAAFFGGAHPRALSLRSLDALATKHLRPAGVRGRLRPRAALVARLETFAVQSSQP